MAYVTTENGLKLRGDIKFFYSSGGDLAPADNAWDPSINDVVADPGLETAVLISLFSDKRANIEDIIPDLNSDDRRGWWGDTLNNSLIGSKFWLLSREKTGLNLNSTVEEYTLDALKWMVSDGIAKSVTCTVTRTGTYSYRIATKISRSNNNDITFTFYYNWLAQTIGG